ncbi:MAG: hypothetical protein ABH871_01465 [Pseudomonadota bacterium]
MKRLCMCLAMAVAATVLFVPAMAKAQSIQTEIPEKIQLSSKVPVSFYGFILAETLYSDSQLSSFGTNNNTAANYNRNMTGFNRVVDESVEVNNDAFLSWTVQNTRFGFMLEPYDFGGKNFTVDARLELDFFSTANLNAGSVVPRIRRAYAGIGQKRWHVLFGHEWDLFSPLNTDTFNVGSNMWRQGNLGFRRPQIRFTYNHPIGDENGFEGALSANLSGNSMAFNDAGNTTCVPMGQARVGFWHNMQAGKFWAYVSAVFGRHQNAVAGNADITNWGIAASFLVPAHKLFKASAEIHYGQSLDSLFSNSSDTTRQRFIAGWGQIKSLWLNWFETNVGYGYEGLKNSQVAAGWVKSNQMAFVNLKFKPIEALAIGPEYNFMRTNYQGSGASKANAFTINAMYYF